MPSSSIKVLLADTHRVLVDAIADHISRQGGLEVVGVATTASETWRRARETSPEVVLSEVHLGDSTAFDVASRVLDRQPTARFVFLAALLSDVLVEQAIRLNAGYLLKTEALEDVVSAIRRCAAGEQVFSPAVADRLRFNTKKQQYELKSQGSVCALTPRQVAILRQIARGRTIRQAAKELQLTEKGAESLKYRLMHKLEIYDQVGLARYAIREGLMTP